MRHHNICADESSTCRERIASRSLRGQLSEQCVVALREVAQVRKPLVRCGLRHAELPRPRRHQPPANGIQSQAAQVVHGRRVGDLPKAALETASTGPKAGAQRVNARRCMPTRTHDPVAFCDEETRRRAA